jgi:uncharacterized protein YjlB
MSQSPTIETRLFAADDDVPNNPLLPLVVYRSALAPGGDVAARCEEMFSRNLWPAAWRNGVYGHHHYHSTAHEALGIVNGSVRVRFGGEHGDTMEVSAGDVVVIPAGVAHKREAASADLLIVGAYPRGQHPDMNTAGKTARERVEHNIAAVPLPEADPVAGAGGPLLECWRKPARG